MTRSLSSAAWCLTVVSLAACENPTETPPPAIELTSSPVPAAVAGNLTFASISATRGMTCARTTTGIAYCWSVLEGGAASTPIPVPGSLRFAAVSSRCGLAASGDTYCWHWPALTPERMPRGVQFATISGGANLLCGLTAEGQGLCWYTIPNSSPWRVPGDLRLTAIAVSNEVVPAFCGISTEESAYCWESFLEPPVLVPGDHRFSSLSVGLRHRCGISGGTAYCWGFNEGGVLGIGTSQRGYATLPRRVTEPQAFVSISSGDNHTCALTEAGVAYCWGRNDSDQLGYRSEERCEVREFRWEGERIYQVACSSVPTPVATDLRFSMISSGASQTCGLTAAGKAYCWGAGAMLGDGRRQDPS